PFDRQDRKEVDPEALHYSGLRLGRVTNLPIVLPVEPFKTSTIGREPNLVGVPWNPAVALRRGPARKRRTFNDNAHLGVEAGRAGVEVERADEDPAPVGRERFRVEARG